MSPFDLWPWSTWLVLVVGTLRLVQLVMHDTILDAPRSWLIERSDARADRAHERIIDVHGVNYVATMAAWRRPRPWLATLLGCVWCVSIWGAAAAVALFATGWVWVLWVWLVLTVSEVVSVADRFIGRMFEG